MLDRHLRVLDINPDHWRRLAGLALGARAGRRLYLQVEGGVPRRLHDTERGDLPLPEGRVEDFAAAAEALFAANPGLREAVVFEPEGLRSLVSLRQREADLGLDPDDLARAAGEGASDGKALAVFPRREFLWNGLPLGRLSKFLALTGSRPSAYLLAVFDGEGLWASLIAEIRAGKVAAVRTFDALPAEELRGLRGPEDHPFLLSLAANTLGLATFGWFVGRADFEAYLAAPDAADKEGIFQRAVMEKRAVFDCSALMEMNVGERKE